MSGPRETVLVTTGNGMFGRALTARLAGRDDVEVVAMVRDASRFTAPASNVRSVTADMDRPDTLAAALHGVTRVFHATPMDEHITERGVAVIDAAVAEDARSRAAGGPGIRQFVYLSGAVDHAGDHLSTMHQRAIDHLAASGLAYEFSSPNSVLETSLLPYAQAIAAGELMGMSGDGRIGFVAVDDVARATAAILTGEPDTGHNHLLTGPAAVTMAEVAAAMSEALGRPVAYDDMTEDDFAAMLLSYGVAPDRQSLETTVLCHLRAWREGRAEVVTDEVERLTGTPAMTVREWAAAHRDAFSGPVAGADG
ncbi:MAG: NmrA family NAD(P)-binding protein [Candidatus Nanopelagicales bacterium]